MIAETESDPVPEHLKVVHYHPRGPELQVVFRHEPDRDSSSAPDFFLRQVAFSCNYAMLLQRRRIFRLALSNLPFAKLTPEKARELMCQVPATLAPTRISCLQVVGPAQDLDGGSFRATVKECNSVCALYGMNFVPGFVLDPLTSDWHQKIADSLEIAAKTSRIAFHFKIPYPQVERSHLETLTSRIHAIVKMAERLKVEAELQLSYFVPPRRDDLWLLIVRSLSGLKSSSAIIQAFVEVDSSAPPGQPRRKVSLLNEVWHDALVEFSRTQNYEGLNEIVRYVSTACEEERWQTIHST